MRGPCCVAVLLLALLACLLSPAAGQGYRAAFSATADGRAQGSVLVLDVSSLWRKHPTQPQISTPDAGECQRRCAKLPGCTAYSFCKDPNGCGRGCAAHVGKNPGVSAITLESQVAPKRGERDMVPSSFKLPLNSFGPYTPNTATKGCAAAALDKWAQGTCTLFKAAGPNRLASAADGAGWVSAWLTSPPPASCNGLSATACAACSSSTNPAGCLACMTDKRALSYIDPVSLVGDGQATGSVGSRTLDQCLACAQLGKADEAMCKQCVLDGQACATCIPYPGSATILAPAAQGPCMSCVEAKGKRFMGSCITCAASSDATRCIKCLDNFFPKMICTTSEYKDCYKPDFDNPCAACAKVSGANYDQCISCFSKPTAKVDCESCAVLQSPTAQATCFSCNAKHPTTSSDTPGGCGLCFSRSKNTASLNQCVACLTDDATTPEKRKVCSMCSSSELSGEQSARCFQCLESSKSGSTSCSVCSTRASTGPAFESCMTCHASPANGPDCRDCDTLGNNLAPTARDALRKHCWDCVVASKLVVPEGAGSAPLGSCQACFASSSTDQKACVACNTNPLVPSIAKGWCVACAGKGVGQRDTCVKCLGANKLDSTGDYRQKCAI